MPYSMICTKNGIMKQFGSKCFEKTNYGTNFLNPVTIIEKNGSFKFVRDVRHLNLSNGQSSQSEPLEVSAAQPARARKK